MKKIRLGIINSTYVKISPFTKKGTEIFANILIKSLVKYYKNELAITSFCSGNSTVSTKKISVMYHPSSENKQVGLKNNHLFEMALFSKAIQMHSKFDLYHFNLGNGEFIFPFASFIKKPIVVTMHGTGKEPYLHRLFHLYKDVPNVYFVTISAYQRKNIPFLQHIKTIHHGIDTDIFAFNEAGNKKIIWSGRAVPEKGLDTVMQIARRLKKPAKIFPIIKTEYIDWLHEEILKKRDIINQIVKIDIDFNVARANLVKEYQQSKVFLFPLKWDEPFGLTMIESMSCGTPVIAYARGSVPEIVKDGETGFIVNPSDDDIRGN
ncbi:MAG: glycosyltransferase, partial [Patescibacteria group bacterium]